MIWKSIEEMPAELKDGRDVLLWEDGSATVACYVDYSPGSLPDGTMGNWHDERGSLGHATVTHFAEIVPPEPDEDRRSEMIHLGV